MNEQARYGAGETRMNEQDLQSHIRMVAMERYGALLMRNNSGVLKRPDGVPVRFGLGNDSKRINQVFKSSDLIGITPMACTCGAMHGVFTAIEIKAPGWKYRPNNETEKAQKNFIDTIRKSGGVAHFIQSEEDFQHAIG